MSNSSQTPREVRNVFISSRSDELAAERSATYDAVSSLGLTPILFEASPNRYLRARQSELTSAGDSADLSIAKERVDAFVDISDFFIGIYHNSIGHRERILGGLRWIEYELLRFVTRHSIERLRGMDGDTEVDEYDIREKLKEKMADPAHLNRLVDALTRPSATTEEARILEEVVKDRVLVFVRGANDEFFRSTHLSRLLRWIPPGRTKDFVSMPIATNRMVKDCLEIPAYVEIYRSICHALEEKSRRVRDEPIAGPLLGVRIRGEDHPNVVYNTLRELFHCGLDVESISMRREPSHQKFSYQDRQSADRCPANLVVDVLTRPISNALAGNTAGKVGLARLRSRVRALLGAALHGSYDVTFPEPGDSQPISENVLSCPQAWSVAYSIDAMAVPGMLWSIVATVSCYGGNIDFLQTSETKLHRGEPAAVALRWRSRVVCFEIGISPAERRDESSPTLSNDADDMAFAYHVRRLPGVVTVRRYEHAVRHMGTASS